MSWRIVPREPRPGDRARVLVVSALAAAVVGGGLLALHGSPPLGVLYALMVEPFTRASSLSETLLIATPIALCALSVSLARWMGLWNIGAEGQLVLGAFAAAGIALHTPGPTPTLGVPLLLAAGALAGAVWAAGPALLRTRLGVSEILSTLMLNYVAVAWIELWIYGPWKDPKGYPYTVSLAPEWMIPAVWGRLHGAFLLVPLLAAGLAWLHRWTLFGYQARLIGASPEAARYAGLPVGERQLTALFGAGALAGVAGAIEVAGVHHRLEGAVSAGYGYTAILAAFIAGARPGWAVVVSVLLAGMDVGAISALVDYPDVPSALVEVIKGVLFVTLLSGEALTRLRIRRGGAHGEAA